MPPTLNYDFEILADSILVTQVSVQNQTRTWGTGHLGIMANLELLTLVVRDYEPAIHFFVDVLQFQLVEDTPSLTNDGRPKRWVVVRPSGAQTGILLARADGDHQINVLGNQFAGRVGLFLRVVDFDATYQRLIQAGVRFVSNPRVEPYGKVAVFLDLEGNRWDLLGPDPRVAEPPKCQ